MSIQYHGSSDGLHDELAASVLAAFWDDLATPSIFPAVTETRDRARHDRRFAFDLAKSVVLTRQGNPDWADSEGDANDVSGRTK